MSYRATTMLIALVRLGSWAMTTIAIVVSIVAFPFVGAGYFLREWWKGE